MVRFFVCLFAMLAGVQALAVDIPMWSWMDQVFRERADEFASRAASFERGGNSVAAADLYREALETLTVDPKNGWRFNAYRKSYTKSLKAQDILAPTLMPGEQFDGENWEGFNPAFLDSTILLKLQFAGKPLRECLDQLEFDYGALNPDSSGLTIKNHRRESERGENEDDSSNGFFGNADSPNEVYLRLSDVSFRKALDYVASLQMLQIKEDDDHLCLEPMSTDCGGFPASLFKIDSEILTGKFGSGEALMKEAGIVLSGQDTVKFFKEGGTFFARGSNEMMGNVLMWTREIKRVENQEEANRYATECLKLAEYYSKLGETELSERRLRQANQTLTWLDRLHPE